MNFFQRVVSEYFTLRVSTYTDAKVSHRDAKRVLDYIRHGGGPTMRQAIESEQHGEQEQSQQAATALPVEHLFTQGDTALEFLRMGSKIRHITTMCSAMDDMLQGGIPLGQITEFCGVPGVGKTQIAYVLHAWHFEVQMEWVLCWLKKIYAKMSFNRLQLAACVQIPHEAFSGCDGQALVIDTEGSFNFDRFEDVVKGLLEHLRGMSSIESDAPLQELTVKKFMDNVFMYRLQNHQEQLSLMNVLPSFIETHPRIKLIIFDSITSHYRHGFQENMALRSRLLHGMAQSLSRIAHKYDIAVVLMNQATTKFSSDREAYLAPALGESWAHACPTRVWLMMKDGQRQAILHKSPSSINRVVNYEVTEHGIRDS